MNPKLIASALCLALAPCLAHATIYFQNSGNTSGWDQLYVEHNGSVTTVNSPVFGSNSTAIQAEQIYDPNYTGRYHAEARLAQGAQQGWDRYYGYALYLPSDWQFVDQNFNIMQFIGTPPCSTSGGKPWTMLWIRNNSLTTRLTTGPDGCNRTDQNFTITSNTIAGTWHTVVIHSNWESDSTGAFTVWYDGNPVIDQEGVPTCPNDDTTMEFAVGQYANGWHDNGTMLGTQSVRDIYIDQVTVADNYTDANPSAGGGALVVSDPTFSPAGGTYSSPQSVTISSSTAGASINYTTDGSTPSETNGTLYSGPITVSSTTTVQAIAFESGMTDSNVISATYTINAGNYTPAQIFSGIQAHMTSDTQVNTLPHINTMTRAMNVNVYQVSTGVFAYTSSMAIDTDGSDPDPDPDHQPTTTWTDDNGAYLGAHSVPYYVLGDSCYDGTSPCPHFYYAENNITGLQFALVFYNGNCIGAVFGDTQTTSTTSTSNNDSRELGEASVEAANLLGIPSSGTTGGVADGVTVVIFSGPQWVVHGTNTTLEANAQALVQQALNQLGTAWGM